jgi:hypothetical protein
MRRRSSPDLPVTPAPAATATARQLDPYERPVRPGPRGWPGRGGGSPQLVEPLDEHRGTTVQVCGLWPFSAGSGTPMIGVPLGRELFSGASVCCDPISWFSRANLIGNPSCWIQGRPGLGKSSLVCRMGLGLAGYGVIPVVLGDLKPDYRDLIQALGGNVVRLGRGLGTLNVLDPGAATRAARRLTGSARTHLIAESNGRRLTMVSTLIGLNRGRPTTDTEESILAAALKVIDEHFEPGEATIRELVSVLDARPDPVAATVLARGDEVAYRREVDPLQRSLTALCDGALGATFAARTSTPIDLGRPLCVDISGIGESDAKLTAAVLLACWGEGFGAIDAHQALADAGLEPRRNWFVVLDELWRVLRAGEGLVDRIDGLTRLNRSEGVGMAMVTHTLADLLSLATEKDRLKAKGFAERAGFIISAGLPASELPALEELVPLTRAERRMLTDWSTPPAWNPRTGAPAEPPGLGRFLIKVGARPGIPIRCVLTPSELALHDTNQRWSG